jgi:hypothetical protein
LNSAIAPQEHRIAALQTAIAEFDHDNEYKHDEELDLHADKILFQKLAFALQVDRSSEEVAMICTALEMVYRASRSRVALSFAELRESVLPIFVEMLGKPLHLRKQEELELAIAEQEERFNSSYDNSSRSGRTSHASGSGQYSSQHSDQPSFASPAYEPVKYGQKTLGDEASLQSMSLQSAGRYELRPPQKTMPDDQSYLSYQSYDQSVQKPGSHPEHKVQPDDQSYLSYQSYDQSLQKPGAGKSSDQSYVSYQSYDQSLQKTGAGKAFDDRSYMSYDQQSLGYSVDDQQSTGQSLGYSVDQSYAEGSYAESQGQSYVSRDSQGYSYAEDSQGYSYAEDSQGQSYVSEGYSTVDRSYAADQSYSQEDYSVDASEAYEDTPQKPSQPYDRNRPFTEQDQSVNYGSYNSGFDRSGSLSKQESRRTTVSSSSTLQTFDRSLSKPASQRGLGDDATLSTFGQSARSGLGSYGSGSFGSSRLLGDHDDATYVTTDDRTYMSRSTLMTKQSSSSDEKTHASRSTKASYDRSLGGSQAPDEYDDETYASFDKGE